ncbi:MAG: hypothetical protein AAGF89_04375 [Bacteroidota bacterium]
MIEPIGPSKHCSCGELFVDCAYWIKVKKRFFELREGMDNLPFEFPFFKFFVNRYPLVAYRRIIAYLLSLGIDVEKIPGAGRFNKVLRENELLMQAVLEVDNNRVFFDSSKPIYHGVFFSASKKYRTYLLWLIRDPRAQSVSALKYNNWTLEYAANHWIKEYELTKRLLVRGNYAHLPISYEAFCRNPRNTLDAINDFADLGIEEWDLNFRRKTLHVMGNYGTRIANKSSAIEERSEWVQKIDTEQRRSLERQLKKYRHLFSETVPPLVD